MRKILLTLATVLLTAILSAQGVFSNKTQAILEKVIQDYPNHFYNIKGELIGQALQTARYKSILQLPGASSCTITLYTARPESSGWSCTVLEAAEFARAKKKFAEIYGQISNSIITAGGQKTYILSGQYEEPTEERSVSRVVFSLLPAMGDMKKLKVELSLQEETGGWKIALSVQDRDPKEETQIAMIAN